MSDAPEPQDDNQIPADQSQPDEMPADAAITPLQEMAITMSEVFESLMFAGFPQNVGAMIIASMLESALYADDDLEITGVTVEEDDEDPQE